ncbi:MAG: hypothetical protein ACKOS8_18705, partial [Gemmataceae bacterium]
MEPINLVVALEGTIMGFKQSHFFFIPSVLLAPVWMAVCPFVVFSQPIGLGYQPLPQSMVNAPAT